MGLDEVRKIVLNDPETKDLDLNDNDLMIAYQYILQRDNNSLKGVMPRLKLTPFIHIDYVPTKERIVEEQTSVLRRNLETFESDIYIADANLDDFIVKDDKHKKALENVKKFLENPLKFQKGLYIYGPYRTGKSFLLSCLANELVKKHVNVVFVFLPDLVRTMKTSIGSNELEKKINILKRCDVLILDDLGGEYMSAWFRDEILLPILHYRLSANLSVFISSNIKKKDLVKTLSGNDSEGDIKVLRLIQRINDLTIPVEFAEKFEKTIE